jgi:protein PhnA
MSTEKSLQARSEGKCELCGTTEGLEVYALPPGSNGSAEACLLACRTCREQIEFPEKTEAFHWRCLNESMWSPVPAVQVLAWRMLKRLSAEGWARDLFDMLYLDEPTLAWAQATGGEKPNEETVKHRDSNGTMLAAGDTITLIKDLEVKGAHFTAKRGTIVRGISLVADNPEHIEARVNGQRIVILTKFVKKAN